MPRKASSKPGSGNATTRRLAIMNLAIHHLPQHGMTDFIIANGSRSSKKSGAGDRISTTYPLCA